MPRPPISRCCRPSGVQISMATVGEATENGYAERLMRTIKEEEVTLHDYIDFHDAYQHLGRFLDDVYQQKRIHSALGYLTPAEFETPMVAGAQHCTSEVRNALKRSNFWGHYKSIMIPITRSFFWRVI